MSYQPELTDADRRIVIVGGPMTGKSTLARQLRQDGYPTLCGDPRPSVRQPEAGVTYMPEGISWDAVSRFVAEHWFPMPGPWVAEGQVMARALRRALTSGLPLPDRILLLPSPHPAGCVTSGQSTLTRAVMTVWTQIAPRLEAITAVLTIEDPVPVWSPLDALKDLGMIVG